jgi:hypothetical protein
MASDLQYDEIAMELDGLSRELDDIITGSGGNEDSNIMDEPSEEEENRKQRKLTNNSTSNHSAQSPAAKSANVISPTTPSANADSNNNASSAVTPEVRKTPSKLLVKAPSISTMQPSVASNFGLDDFHQGPTSSASASASSASVRNNTTDEDPDGDSAAHHSSFVEELSALNVAASFEQLPQLASKSLFALGDILQTLTTVASSPPAPAEPSSENSPAAPSAEEKSPQKPAVSENSTDGNNESDPNANADSASGSGGSSTMSAVSGWMSMGFGLGLGLAAHGWSVASEKAKDVASSSATIMQEAVTNPEHEQMYFNFAVEDDSREVQVPANHFTKIPFIVPKGKAMMWRVLVRQYDIGFAVKTQVQEDGGAVENEIEDWCKCHSGDIVVGGRKAADIDRKILLEFDNSYSKLRSKTLSYQMLIGQKADDAFAKSFADSQQLKQMREIAADKETTASAAVAPVGSNDAAIKELSQEEERAHAGAGADADGESVSPSKSSFTAGISSFFYSVASSAQAVTDKAIHAIEEQGQQIFASPRKETSEASEANKEELLDSIASDGGVVISTGRDEEDIKAKEDDAPSASDAVAAAIGMDHHASHPAPAAASSASVVVTSEQAVLDPIDVYTSITSATTVENDKDVGFESHYASHEEASPRSLIDALNDLAAAADVVTVMEAFSATTDATEDVADVAAVGPVAHEPAAEEPVVDAAAGAGAVSDAHEAAQASVESPVSPPAPVVDVTDSSDHSNLVTISTTTSNNSDGFVHVDHVTEQYPEPIDAYPAEDVTADADTAQSTAASTDVAGDTVNPNDVSASSITNAEEGEGDGDDAEADAAPGGAGASSSASTSGGKKKKNKKKGKK